VLKTGGKEYAKAYLCLTTGLLKNEEEDCLFDFSSTFMDANHNLVLVFSINKAAKSLKLHPLSL
jgi:hypothetical protein